MSHVLSQWGLAAYSSILYLRIVVDQSRCPLPTRIEFAWLVHMVGPGMGAGHQAIRAAQW